MRPAEPPLLPILRSKVIGQLLGLLATDERRWWGIDELAGRTGGAYPTVAREVRRLQDASLVEVEEIGRSKRVRFSGTSPLHKPLAELMTRAFGPVTVIAEEFADLVGVDQVSIFGSWAARHSGEPGATPNDVDVLVLGKPDRDEVYDAARRAEERLGLPVNTAIRGAAQWASANDSFAMTVKGSPIVAVVPREAA